MSPPRIVAFLPGFEPESKSYSGIQYGTPVNYTHVIIAFVGSYHYYMGLNVTMGCSTNCTVGALTYFDSKKSEDVQQVTHEIITSLKTQNPRLKILFSFGGSIFDNSDCNYECTDPTMEPLQYFYSNSQGTPLPPDGNGNCSPVTSNKKPPSDYCAQIGGEKIAQHLIDLITLYGVDGVDMDFEATIYAYEKQPGDTVRSTYLKFYRDLVSSLRQKKSDIIISVSPQSPYLNSRGVFPNSYQFHKDWLTPDIVSQIDMINIQFYNNEPEDTNTTTENADAIIKLYNNIASDFKFPVDKMNLGMCATREDGGVCKYCTFNTLQGSIANNQCTDPQWRLNQIIKPLYNKGTLGGIMFWNTSGDVNGEFSGPFQQLFSSSPPSPSPPSPTPPSPSPPSPSPPSPKPPSPSPPSPTPPSPTPPSPTTGPSPPGPQPAPSPSSNKNKNTWWIVGGVLAGAIVLALIILIGVVMIKKKQKAPKRRNNTSQKR